MTPSGDRRATPDRAGDHRWVILAGMCLVTAVTEFDETVMAVALPRIDASFDASLPAVQWSVTAYVPAFAAVLIPAGRLADSLGARRGFLAGAAVFAAGSAACALAPDVGWLIGARVVHGLGEANGVGFLPGSLAILVLGVALLLLLALSDARQRHPLLNLGLLRIRSYAGVNAVMLIAATAWLAMLLLQGIYL